MPVEVALTENVSAFGAAVVLRPVLREWWCPACRLMHQTRGSANKVPLHACKAHKGLTVAMVPAGKAGKVERRDREDYVGSEDVQVDGDGRPVMSTVTTRDDGEDAVIFAPTAHENLREMR